MVAAQRRFLRPADDRSRRPRSVAVIVVVAGCFNECVTSGSMPRGRSLTTRESVASLSALSGCPWFWFSIRRDARLQLSEMRWYNVILKAATASPSQLRELHTHLRSHRRGRGRLRQRITALTRFSIGANGGAPHTLGLTAIRALRMQRDQRPKGRTILPSRSGRQASGRPPCCHKESVAAYQ